MWNRSAVLVAARGFRISPPFVTQIARLPLFPTHNKLPIVSVGQPSYTPFRMPVSHWDAWASLSAPPQGPPELQTALAPRTEIQIPPSLSFRLESCLLLAGQPVLRAHPEPLIPSLQDGLQPSASGCALGVTQRPWNSGLPDQPSNRRSSLGSDQVGGIGSAQPTRAPCQDFSSGPSFPSWLPDGPGIWQREPEFSGIAFTGNLAYTNLPLHVASILAGFISLVCCSLRPPPSFFFIYKSPTC